MAEFISSLQVAEVDAMLGRVLAALEASGAASRTYVVFTSDHGEMHLEHRFVEKMSMYVPRFRYSRCWLLIHGLLMFLIMRCLSPWMHLPTSYYNRAGS